MHPLSMRPRSRARAPPPAARRHVGAPHLRACARETAFRRRSACRPVRPPFRLRGVRRFRSSSSRLHHPRTYLCASVCNGTEGAAAIHDDAILELARARFGFERLRAGQRRAVAAAVAGRDVLAVLPTGGGKSAIYELAGLLRAGPTVVVSPLIALQDDQLAHLRAAGLTATVLNSKQSARARREALAAVHRPDEYVFLSPEQLSNGETREALRSARPGLFVVDEAHLISQWGEDFRPDYLRLGGQADAIEAPVRLALTATAAPPVRDEIIRRLGLDTPEVVIGDFDRPAIELSVHHVRSVRDKQ